MTIQELEDFLYNTDLPETAMLNKATKITDMNTFITTNLPRLKAWNGDIDSCPSYWHLNDLVKVLKA